MEGTRDSDRAALPEPMRRDVRLLGDILGEIIRDSGGPELLADVERLRRAVIEARQREEHHLAAAGDEIVRLVSSWSLEQAEQVARAFAVYFHLANLAEEHQRIRNLRDRDTGQEPVRESLAAAVAEISHEAGPEHLRELLASLRVHLVLTAHPTERRPVDLTQAGSAQTGPADFLTVTCRFPCYFSPDTSPSTSTAATALLLRGGRRSGSAGPQCWR